MLGGEVGENIIKKFESLWTDLRLSYGPCVLQTKVYVSMVWLATLYK